MTKKIILVVVAVVIFTLLVVGGGLFYGYKIGFLNKLLGNVPTTPITKTPIEQSLVGNDKDAYGCIPSAGYSWCEVKQKCLRTFEEACVVEQPAAVETPPVKTLPVVDETELVKSAIIEELVKEHGEDFRQMDITVSKIEGDFAKGGASGDGGGGMWLAAKVGDTWKLVWDGNGVIYCEDLAPYPDFPKSFVAECYDKATDNLVTR